MTALVIYEACGEAARDDKQILAAFNMTSVEVHEACVGPAIQLQIPRGLTSARDDKQILAGARMGSRGRPPHAYSVK